MIDIASDRSSCLINIKHRCFQTFTDSVPCFSSFLFFLLVILPSMCFPADYRNQQQEKWADRGRTVRSRIEEEKAGLKDIAVSSRTVVV